MISKKKYIFTSPRLGFRNWITEDLEIMSEINANANVMEFFPSTQTKEQTAGFIERMQQMFVRTGFCYFAVDDLEDGRLIGFIGLAEQNYEADFTPCIDIGWRLHPNAWYKSYATEGAKACLDYAFNTLKLDKVYATAPLVNIKSIAVMKKIGMQEAGTFVHPLLVSDERLKDCALYVMSRPS